MVSKKDAFIKVFKALSAMDNIEIWNSLCHENREFKDIVHLNNEYDINRYFGSSSAPTILQSIKEFRSSDKYFLATEDGIRSFSDLSDGFTESEWADKLLLRPYILNCVASKKLWSDIFQDTFKEFLQENDIPNEIIENRFFRNDDLLKKDWNEFITTFKETGEIGDMEDEYAWHRREYGVDGDTEFTPIYE